MDLAAARTRLEGVLADLDASASTLRGEGGDLGELSHLDQHPAEAASELTEQERDEAVIAVVTAQRHEVVAALRRLDEGTYGRCVDCGEPLPDERLDARPEAARCMSCQQKLENSQ